MYVYVMIVTNYTCIHLDVVQPWAEVLDASLSFSDVPDHQVERPRRHETLVGRIVLLLHRDKVTW